MYSIKSESGSLRLCCATQRGRCVWSLGLVCCVGVREWKQKQHEQSVFPSIASSQVSSTLLLLLQPVLVYSLFIQTEMASRIIAQLIVQGASIFSKAFVSAYHEALKS